MKQVPLYDEKPIEFGSVVYSLNRNDHILIEKKLTTLLKDLEDFTARSLRDQSALRALGLPEDLAPEPTPLGLHIPFARFDCLWDGKDLFVLELNTDGTSGWNLVQWLNSSVGVSPASDPNLELSERLLSGLRAHRPKASQIVLCDEREVKTVWEQKDLIERWNKMLAGGGVKAMLADPAVRAWQEGALVYRRMVSWVLRAKTEQSRAFLADWKSKKITVVGGWSSDVAHSKVWPALFQTPLAPKTFLVDEKIATRGKSERENFILKAALSNAGRGVFVGKDFSDKQWDSCLQTALKETLQGRSWVLQERKPIPRWKVDGKDLGVELGVYFINGKWAGYLVRAGNQSHISDAARDLTYPIQIV